jgi:hypothetical protein
MAETRDRGETPIHAGWDDVRQQHLEAWMHATPAQRLAWLEEAIRLAYRTGALPRRGRSEE